MSAYNETSLRQRQFRRLRRTEIWMPAAEFLERYAADAQAAEAGSL